MHIYVHVYKSFSPTVDKGLRKNIKKKKKKDEEDETEVEKLEKWARWNRSTEHETEKVKGTRGQWKAIQNKTSS